MDNLPDYQQAVEYLFTQTSQIVLLSAFTVGVINQIKSVVPEAIKKFMWLVAIIIGIGFMALLSVALPEAFVSSVRQIVLFWFVIGLGASWLYELGLGKKKD